MSMPFIEMPQRAEALPSMRNTPPRPVAPADGGVARHMHEAGHHVLGDADPRIAVDQHGGELVHPGAVIADRPSISTVIGALSPAAMAWRPAGWSTIQCRSLVSGLSR